MDYKNWIGIGISVILLVALITVSIVTGDKVDKYDIKIQALNDTIRIKENKLASFKIEEKNLQEQLKVREQEIVSLNKYIKTLKKRNYEKADSVYKLDNERTIKYTSEWLSKRNSTK